MKHTLLYIYLLVLIVGCKSFSKNGISELDELPIQKINSVNFDTILFAKSFDYPVGKPDAKGYYNAQKFGENDHLGDDWNGLGGGDSDLGDPIFAVANGYVSFAKNIQSGWGNIVRVTHYIDEYHQLESFYAHCDSILVKKGDPVLKGQQIATIGNNDGQYLAHLHFEMRSDLSVPIGGGYSGNYNGFINPSLFIKRNRTIAKTFEF